MDVSRPFTALSPNVDADVLVALAGSTRPRTGREIQRLTGRSGTGVRHVLKRLVEQGLVVREAAGSAHAYTLNRDHLLAPAVEQMAAARNELFKRLRAAMQEWELAPIHASLFGSAARGDGDVESDIDLFIVRPKTVNPDNEVWRGQIDALSDAVHRWTGNHAGVGEVSEADLPGLKRKNPKVLRDVRADAIELAGRNVRDTLGGKG